MKSLNISNNILTKHIEKKIDSINQGNFNLKSALKISIEVLIIGVFYFLYCHNFFKGIWYLELLIIISTIIFMFNYIDIRLELIQNRFRSDIPKTIRKLRFYLIHTQNISKALEKTILKSPDSTKIYMQKLKKAVDSENVIYELNQIKKNTKFEWLNMLCTLVQFSKIYGDKDKIASKNFKRVINVIELININKGRDNAEMVGSQIFIFIMPLICIPGIQYFQKFLTESLGTPNVALNQNSMIKAAQILLISNLLSLFIAWIRKNG